MPWIRRPLVVRYAAGCGLPSWSGPAARHAEPAATPQLPIETYTLANGLKVALSHDPAAPRTTVSVAYHVGSKNERPGLTGFAHFFEHMMFRGTQNVPNFDEPLQEAGGASNAFTSEDVTVYFETVPNNYVQRALYMEAERMAFLSSALSQEKFDTEREVVKNERRQVMENVPYGLADETLSFSRLSARTSVFVVGDRIDGGLEPRDAGGSAAVLPGVLSSGQCHVDAGRRIRSGGNEAVDRDLFWPAGGRSRSWPHLQVPPTAPRAQRVVQKDRVQFPRVYWAWPTVAETHPDAPALDLLAHVAVRRRCVAADAGVGH